MVVFTVLAFMNLELVQSFPLVVNCLIFSSNSCVLFVSFVIRSERNYYYYYMWLQRAGDEIGAGVPRTRALHEQLIRINAVQGTKADAMELERWMRPAERRSCDAMTNFPSDTDETAHLGR